MFNFFQKDDARIQKDVRRELIWDPSISASKIEVESNDGIITLSGSVPHYSEKMKAEKAVQRVGGVQGVADELEVNLDDEKAKSDAEIAAAAVNALTWNYEVPTSLKVSVDRGWLTLSGEVDWDFQKNSARDAVSLLLGVRGLTSEITIKTRLQPLDLKMKIEEALKRSAENEGRDIKVAVDGDKVTLTGNVHSLSEMNDAGLAIWNAPGVGSLDNNLKIAN